MAYGSKFYTASGEIQIDDQLATLHVVQEGTIASGTSINFARQSGALYIRPTNYGGSIWLDRYRSAIYCNNGSISFVVLQSAANYTPPSGYGLLVKGASNTLMFSDKMKFPKIRYSSLIGNLKNSPLTINLSSIYPNSHPYISVFSLGLDSFQVGLSYLTYRNIIATFNSTSQVYLSTVMEQSSSGWWSSYDFTRDIQNYVQIVMVN